MINQDRVLSSTVVKNYKFLLRNIFFVHYFPFHIKLPYYPKFALKFSSEEIKEYCPKGAAGYT